MRFPLEYYLEFLELCILTGNMKVESSNYIIAFLTIIYLSLQCSYPTDILRPRDPCWVRITLMSMSWMSS